MLKSETVKFLLEFALEVLAEIELVLLWEMTNMDLRKNLESTTPGSKSTQALD